MRLSSTNQIPKTRMPPVFPALFRRPFLAGIVVLSCCSATAISTAAMAAQSALTSQQCRSMQQHDTISSANPVPCTRLMQVTFSYVDFAGRRHDDGRVVVLDAIAPQVQAIFDALLARGFPIQQARPLEDYDGDDEAAMRANNTSAFNGRPITGGGGWSKHAYGVAIDINPRQNPYLSKPAGKAPILLPPDAGAYRTRTPLRAGMAESVRDIFFRHGFLIWGGHWRQPIDYQHFEIGSRQLINELLALSPSAAQAAFRSYAMSYTNCLAANGVTDPDAVVAATLADACARQSKR